MSASGSSVAQGVSRPTHGPRHGTPGTRSPPDVIWSVRYSFGLLARFVAAISSLTIGMYV
eukprot:3469207-Pyramimonas_sp.AAC.1